MGDTAHLFDFPLHIQTADLIIERIVLIDEDNIVAKRVSAYFIFAQQRVLLGQSI